MTGRPWNQDDRATLEPGVKAATEVASARMVAITNFIFDCDSVLFFI